MAVRVPPLPEAQVESLARLLGDCGTGSDISRVLKDRGIADRSGESTKWRRLYTIFLDLQRRESSANRVLDFVQAFLSPARYVGRSEEFEAIREALNPILAFAGLEFGNDGKFRDRAPAETLDEAEARAQTIRAKFKSRAIHPEVLKYCRAELMKDDYFHAVFEAAKGLAQRIRDMAGVDGDGAALVDKVFGGDKPMLAFNSFQSETERSEHRGYAALLKGCFAAVRNPPAHTPRVLWQGEEDAADHLSLISLLHRKLDKAVPTGYGGSP